MNRADFLLLTDLFGVVLSVADPDPYDRSAAADALASSATNLAHQLRRGLTPASERVLALELAKIAAIAYRTARDLRFTSIFIDLERRK